MSKITKIQRKVPKDVTLPDGIYTGLWGGYHISLKYDDKEYDLTTEEGVRGFNINVVVTIKDGEANFESITN